MRSPAQNSQCIARAHAHAHVKEDHARQQDASQQGRQRLATDRSDGTAIQAGNRHAAAGWPLYRLLGGAAKPIKAYAGGIALGWQEPSLLVMYF